MKSKTKSIVTIVFLASLLAAGYYFRLLPGINPEKPVNTPITDKLFGWKFPVAKFPLAGPDQKQLAYSDIRDPGGIPQGLPVRLKIPVIGVDSTIEDAVITKDGRMDVPFGSVNVAWFSLGPHPGKEGSAVIGGHYGIKNGVPFVFYKLDTLKSGDKVYIVDDKGDTLAFIVRSVKLFDRNANTTTVFTSNDGLAHLNLITCEGTWNQVNDTYPDRRVVFTDAIPGEGAVVVTTPPPVTAKPKIVAKSIIAPTPLPTVLPTPMPTPTETPTISPTESPTELPIILPIIPPTRVEKSPDLSQTIIQSVKGFYATPLDGLITSFLLISIAFVSTKIIRRDDS